jgi:hypothetical protein
LKNSAGLEALASASVDRAWFSAPMIPALARRYQAANAIKQRAPRKKSSAARKFSPENSCHLHRNRVIASPVCLSQDFSFSAVPEPIFVSGGRHENTGAKSFPFPEGNRQAG